MTKSCRYALMLILIAGLCPAHAGTAAAPPKSGIAVADIDPAVRPGEDFYQHVNGAWHKRNPIPDNKSGWGPTAQVDTLMRERLRQLIETAAGDSTNPDARKVADFFASAMDEQGIEKLGLTPLAAELKRIDALHSKAALASYLAHLHAIGVPLGFEFNIHRDARDAQHFVADLAQAELGMPDRDYYLQRDDATVVDTRAKYVDMLARLLTLAGDGQAAAHAGDILALETALAKAQWNAADSNDPKKTSNPVTLAQLSKLAPGFDWPAYLKGAGLPHSTREIILSQPSYLSAFAELAGSTPLATWKHYLAAQLIGVYGSKLSSPFVQATFDFYATTLSGRKTSTPRWQMAVNWTESALSDVLGKLYVQRHFPPAHQARAKQLVAAMVSEFRASLDQVEWMAPETKQEAQAKLATLVTKVGYPTVWHDYRGLVVRKDDIVGNLMRARSFERRLKLALLTRPQSDDDWDVPPQTISASYKDDRNEIQIPAGRLQAPWFDIEADDAVNFGAIASVIGHEISHAFDNAGAQYDSKGKLRNWWSAADRATFNARSQRMVAQYGRYSPLPGYQVNGQLTLGENIADNIGLAVALRAYHRTLDGKPGPVLEGYTADQRFFMGFARSRSTIRRDAEVIARLKGDPHSPDPVRINGTVRNQDAFYDAFQIVPGDPMYLAPADRVKIW